LKELCVTGFALLFSQIVEGLPARVNYQAELRGEMVFPANDSARRFFSQFEG